MINKITSLIDVPERDFIYDILDYYKPELCVDVGAAAGVLSRRMSLAGDKNNRVVSFEPFPGNYPYFEQVAGNIENIRLIKKQLVMFVESLNFQFRQQCRVWKKAGKDTQVIPQLVF